MFGSSSTKGREKDTPSSPMDSNDKEKEKKKPRASVSGKKTTLLGSVLTLEAV